MFKQVVSRLFKLGAAMWLIVLVVLPVQAISLSTFRIYLDSANSSASFVMSNREAVAQVCRLNLVHHNFDEMGKMSKVDSAILPNNSANPWVRFSPKNFTAAPRTSQTVRFSLRRKPDTVAQEYRSYLEVYCDSAEFEAPRTGTGNFSIKPRLVPNVPIIVRTGKLETQLSMSDFYVEDEKVFFTLNRQGDRSVYGTVELINKQNNDVINRRKNISVYTETKKLKLELANDGTPVGQLAVHFVEDKRYGGTITYQQDVVLN